jgi:hypothetical protein
MFLNFIYFFIICLVTFPLTHVFIKKGMILDYKLTKSGIKKLNIFFYIPFLNLIIGLFYLIWVVFKFKRPE